MQRLVASAVVSVLILVIGGVWTWRVSSEDAEVVRRLDHLADAGVKRIAPKNAPRSTGEGPRR